MSNLGNPELESSANADGNRSRSRSRDLPTSAETAFNRGLARILRAQVIDVARLYAEHDRNLRQIDREMDERILRRVEEMTTALRNQEREERILNQVEERMNTLMNLERDDTSEGPVLADQQNTIEGVVENPFTGTAHRLQ